MENSAISPKGGPAAAPIHYARALTIIGWLELVEALEMDADALLAQAGLNRGLISKPDNLIPYQSIVRLTDLSAREAGIDNFGLKLTQYWPDPSQVEGALGFLTQLMMHSSTIAEAWQYFCDHYHLHSQGVAWSLKWDEKYAYIQREGLLPAEVPTFQTASINLAHILTVMRHLLDSKQWSPSFVCFSYKAPKEVAYYQNYFGCPVHFSAECSYIAFPTTQLKEKISYTDSKLQALLKAKLNELEGQKYIPGDKLSRLQVLIRQGLRSGECSQENIAQLMLMHPKKLQRELKAQGISFRDLKAKVRLDLAEHFIKDSKMPLTAIAEMLGYSALSSLSRAFKDRHQVPPQDWRS